MNVDKKELINFDLSDSYIKSDLNKMNIWFYNHKKL